MVLIAGCANTLPAAITIRVVKAKCDDFMLTKFVKGCKLTKRYVNVNRGNLKHQGSHIRRQKKRSENHQHDAHSNNVVTKPSTDTAPAGTSACKAAAGGAEGKSVSRQTVMYVNRRCSLMLHACTDLR